MCSKCWKPGDSNTEFLCVNLGSSTITSPKPRMAMDTYTTSNIPNLLVTPTSVKGSGHLPPGMVHNEIAELAMV
jgi:hypothetical protein